MKKVGSIFWSLILIAVGVIFFGNLLEFWNLEIFFDGWWTLFIIIPSLYGFFKREWISSTLGLIIGILLLMAARDYIEWNIVGKAFIPILLIVIGISLIFKPKRHVSVNEKGLPEYIGVFSGNEEKITDTFKGAECVSVFGSVSLDLSKAKIKEDIIIECVAVFGGITIKLPDNVKVKTSGVPIFGGLENAVTNQDGPIVEINYVSIFGGVDLK